MKEPAGAEVVEVFDGLSARLAEQAGFDALMLGAGMIANFSYGLPDMGLLSVEEFIAGVRRIGETVAIPMILDIDRGGSTLAQVRRTVQLAERAGTAGVVIGDTEGGHRAHGPDGRGRTPGSKDQRLLNEEDAAQRVSTALDARTDGDFVLIARIDTHVVHSGDLEEARQRAELYAQVGADVLFLDGVPISSMSEAMRGLAVPVMVSSRNTLTKAEKDAITASGAVLCHQESVSTRAFIAIRDCLHDLRAGVTAEDGRDHTADMDSMRQVLGSAQWSRLAVPDEQ